MDPRTKGAWLLAQSKSLEAVTGAGTGRLENISYAGRVGRLYNLLRRNVGSDPNPTVNASTIQDACKLNNLDRPTREAGLRILQATGRIDFANNGGVIVLGATSRTVLETTAEIFDDLGPTSEEHAALDLSEKVADLPLTRDEATEFIGDEHRLTRAATSSVIDLCKATAMIDEESEQDRVILFNSNTFRDGQYAAKALRILEGLNADDRARLAEVQEKLASNGALYEADVEHRLGGDLYRRLVSVGFFDRMEINNSTESVGYVASPNDFQKFGRPFEEDPIDDAKALLASVTYGQTRSSHRRGRITMPEALLQALVDGREVAKYGIPAIGEDYRELEVRQVVQVIPKGPRRFGMRLLKRDVGEIALAIVRGGGGAEEAVLLDGSPARNFKGPHVARMEIRARNSIQDKRYLVEGLERLRSGG